METEMKNIMRKFFTSESEVFTGFHATYSRGNFYSTEGVPLSKMHIAWAENEPNNVGNNENCITLNVNGELADRSCDEPRPYICFRSADMKTEVNKCGTIDPEYELDEATDTCYKFHSVARTFSGAHFACSAEGGHLAIIKSDVEAAVLKKVFAKYPVAKILGSFKKDIAFVGFHGWADTSDWRTIHGQTLQEAGYSKFASGEPSNSTTGEFCGGICRSALLNDLACEKPIAFICQKKRDFPPVC
ncbi:hypothetical protein HW555_009795 [Spodoptera exigua]|uniref:C-type lectin domain-containing protein n=1 Tax=Spodoptera exigua TaxID=7107 RepID=A0A835GCC5_SPOEX|nr:hypothetical protein HW555_009795 [Spodoptera exigua]